MENGLRIIVLIKQVPDTSSKAGVNPDGTVDRARAKRMMNPFDQFALQKALELKQQEGGEVIVVSMGPGPAIEVVVEALEYGADRGFLLSDRKLAASDTLATAYALYKSILYINDTIGNVDIIFTGLQTTDGDTAQTGPQIAERLDWPQITYLENLTIKDGLCSINRIVEGGHQELSAKLPLLMTVANSATKLEAKRFLSVYKVRELLRNRESYDSKVKVITLSDIDADSTRVGLVGSPTVVGKTWKLGEIGGKCQLFGGRDIEEEVPALLDAYIEDKGVSLEELVK
ncbi:MAG: electron transfer flavoprotein subunit beta/FixA family protein [Nitrospinota bacterium]